MFNNFVYASAKQKGITFILKKFNKSVIKTTLIFKVTGSCNFFLLSSCFNF